MYKKIPEPKTALVTPKYEISDHTAALKTRRLMQELKGYATAENWISTLRQLGLKAGISNTRRWRRVLKLPYTRKDVIAACLDRNGDLMDQPDPKETAEVMVWLLTAAPPEDESDDSPNTDLYLSVIGFKRSEVLHPEKAKDPVGAPRTMLKVSFHALQRMIQRGYGLSVEGELSYLELLFCITGIWGAANNEMPEKPTHQVSIKVEYKGATFVLKMDTGDTEMTLVTMLSPKK